MTKFILIASGKGGVGKTTVSINLGTAFVYFGRNAVVVDGNLNKANVGLHLGSPLLPTTIHDVIQGKAKIDNAVYQHNSGLKIIPADISYENLKEEHHENLADNLITLNSRTDFVILDSPPGLGKEFSSLLKTADEVIVLTTPDMPSVTDAMKTIRFCEEKGANVIGVLVNKQRNDPFELNLENIRSFLEKPIISTIAHDNSIRESLHLKQPVIYSHPTSKSTISFKKLAALILGEKYVENIEKKEEKYSKFKKLLKELGLKK